MSTTPTKPAIDMASAAPPPGVPRWPVGEFAPGTSISYEAEFAARRDRQPSRMDALQALLAFSAMHQQVLRRRALASQFAGFDTIARDEFESSEQFVLDEVLQLVAERAIAITGADGLGIALAENNEIVLRASAGAIKPDVGARIQRDSAFSGACFRMAQVIRCDDTETDDRVNLYACRQLGARSMVAVPLCGRRRVIGLLEAFSAEPFGFNDSDVASLELLAELVVSALKPEDEDRFAQSAQVAVEKLAGVPSAPTAISSKPATGPANLAAPNRVTQEPISETAFVVQAKSVEPGPLSPAAAPVRVAISSKTEMVAELSALGPSLASDKIIRNEANAGTKSSTQHPGTVLLLVLIVVATVLAGGVWWKLKTAQLGSVVVQPEQKITKAATPVTSSLPPSPAISVGAQSNPAVHTDAAVENGLGDEKAGADSGVVATPQELAKLPRVTGIRHWSSQDASTVVLDLEDQVQYEAHRLARPDRIYFDLHDTSLSPGLEGKSIEIGDALLARVRVAQPSAGLSRVVLETKNNSDFSVSLEPNPYRLLVQVRKTGASPKAEVNLFPGSEVEKMEVVVPPPSKEDLQLRARVPKMRIVVDAGHGGWDLGTVGRRGLLEKDLVLEIAQRLGKLLESRLGAEVVLTRNDDNYIPLDERAGIANQAQADLFISVHANYSDLPSARGVETYYTNFFTQPSAKELETRSGIGMKNFTGATLSAADLHEKIEQSRLLAASVQRSLYGTLAAQNPGLRDRGIKEASYVVLTETAMPGILAEVSFVSSPADEQKLQSDGYREQIAEALYRGIARYAANSHPVKMARK